MVKALVRFALFCAVASPLAACAAIFGFDDLVGDDSVVTPPGDDGQAPGDDGQAFGDAGSESTVDGSPDDPCHDGLADAPNAMDAGDGCVAAP